MSAANWQGIEDALQAACAKALGLPGASVVWDMSNGPRPHRPFATLHLEGGDSAGGQDEQRVGANPASAPGAEILLESIAHGEHTLTVQVFTTETRGPSSARALLTQLRNALGAEGTVNSLEESSGIAVIDRGAVQNLTALLESGFEGRAALDVRFRVVDGTSETATFIETVGPVAATYEQ